MIQSDGTQKVSESETFCMPKHKFHGRKINDIGFSDPNVIRYKGGLEEQEKVVAIVVGAMNREPGEELSFEF